MNVVRLAAIATALACSAGAPAGDDTTRLREVLEKRFPDVTVDRVSPAPVAGLYEVYTPGEVVYVDASGEYMFVGKLLATSTRRDLSAASWNEHNRIEFAKLPLDAAIKTVRGAGTRTLAVFTDPDCPYCRNLEKELAQLDDVTIYSFLYPLEQLHKGATTRARRIWCAADRTASWRAWMLESVQPAAAECPVDPVQGNLELGTRLRVQVTPTLFFVDGSRASGAMPHAELEKWLNRQAAAGKSVVGSARHEEKAR